MVLWMTLGLLMAATMAIIEAMAAITPSNFAL
jgi:hypothetical protein